MLCDNREFIQPLIPRRNKFMEVVGELLALKQGQIVKGLFPFKQSFGNHARSRLLPHRPKLNTIRMLCSIERTLEHCTREAKRALIAENPDHLAFYRTQGRAAEGETVSGWGVVKSGLRLSRHHDAKRSDV